MTLSQTALQANLGRIHTEAMDAARDAIIANAWRERPNAFDCGFAWVTMSGNLPLARYLRKAGIGSKGYPSGWQLWMPGRNEAGFGGQSIAVFEAGAKAYRDSVARHGIVVDVGSRLD